MVECHATAWVIIRPCDRLRHHGLGRADSSLSQVYLRTVNDALSRMSARKAAPAGAEVVDWTKVVGLAMRTTSRLARAPNTVSLKPRNAAPGAWRGAFEGSVVAERAAAILSVGVIAAALAGCAGQSNGFVADAGGPSDLSKRAIRRDRAVDAERRRRLPPRPSRRRRHRGLQGPGPDAERPRSRTPDRSTSPCSARSASATRRRARSRRS